MIIHRKLDVHLLELGVLGFNVAEPLHARSLHAAAPGIPDLVGRIRNAKLTAHILDPPSSLNLL